jgi:Uncharacterized protein conserved in archaea
LPKELSTIHEPYCSTDSFNGRGPAAGGCALSQQKDETTIAQQDILEQQQLLLDEQGQQLQSLVQAQRLMSEQMQSLQTQVADMHSIVTRKDLGAEPLETRESPIVELPVPALALGADNKLVIGRVEWAWLDIANQRFKARIDTGAASSLLYAADIQPFERNGSKWVRFQIPTVGEDRLFESPLVRIKKIRQTNDGEVEKRPVVRLMVRIGDIIEDVEFNLSDRDSMIYPILLGRSFLQDIAVVDVSQKFTQPKVELASP